jgi:hypothetical protein
MWRVRPNCSALLTRIVDEHETLNRARDAVNTFRGTTLLQNLMKIFLRLIRRNTFNISNIDRLHRFVCEL